MNCSDIFTFLIIPIIIGSISSFIATKIQIKANTKERKIINKFKNLEKQKEILISISRRLDNLFLRILYDWKEIKNGKSNKVFIKEMKDDIETALALFHNDEDMIQTIRRISILTPIKREEMRIFDQRLNQEITELENKLKNKIIKIENKVENDF